MKELRTVISQKVVLDMCVGWNKTIYPLYIRTSECWNGIPQTLTMSQQDQCPRRFISWRVHTSQLALTL